MIISFSLENWMSFQNPVTFSMIASREKQHGDRVPKIGKYQTRVLPIAVIYGGNASGKTNFFKAINFVKNLVIRGAQPNGMIPVESFRLGAKNGENPTRFKLELLINEIIYEFSFAVTRRAVLEEKLVQVTGDSEKILYDRQGNKPNFDSSLDKHEFLHFAFQGTQNNQLFLTNSVSQKVEVFRPIYDWFSENLELIAPDSRFASFDEFIDEEHPLYNTMNDILPQLDTGISHLESEEVPFDSISFPELLKSKLQEETREGVTFLVLTPIGEYITVTRRSGDLVTKKLVSFHTKSDGTEAKFEIHQESDGSKRVLDLLPAFLDVSVPNTQKVYIIDEIDRSLHSLLTRQLLEGYLSTCSTDSRAQLLITTHDVLLMDQQLFRRDEMWVAERDIRGSSNLFSFSDYKDIRYDKDIKKSYLQGRLGGIPRILLNSSITNCKEK